MNLAFLNRQLKLISGKTVQSSSPVEKYLPEKRPMFNGNATSNFHVPISRKEWPSWFREWHTMCLSAFVKGEADVCIAWRDSATFKEWYDRKYVEGNVLCARFAFIGERLYSPYTTAFVTPALSKWMIPKPTEACLRGVVIRKNLYGVSYLAGISKNRTRISLGRYKTKEEAHRAWIREKIKIGKELLNDNVDNVIAVRGVTRVLDYLQDCYDNNKEVNGL